MSKAKAVILLGVFTLGVFLGQYTKKPDIKIVTKYKEVTKESAEKIVIKEITKEGKTRIITKYKVNTVVKKNKSTKKQVTSYVPEYGINIGASLFNSKYMISVDKRLFGKLSVGLYGNVDTVMIHESDYGLYLRIEF